MWWESTTIGSVESVVPRIFAPKAIYAWAENSRSFIVFRRIKSLTLRDAWRSSKLAQQRSALMTTADYCDYLAEPDRQR